MSVGFHICISVSLKFSAKELLILNKTYWENLPFIFNQLISLNSATLNRVFFSICKENLTYAFLSRRFSYAGNWELVKSIVGTKFRRSHVCLRSQARIRLWQLIADSALFRYAMIISLQKLIHVIKQIQQALEYRDTTAKY